MMSDPAIKLFGMTIALPLAGDEGGGGGGEPKGSPVKETTTITHEKTKDRDEVEQQDSAQQSADTTTSEKTEPLTSSPADETHNPNNSGSVDDPQETETSDKVDDHQQTDSASASNSSNNCKPALKKPDKILPCPRCNSMDTKFCYYNNYNVNQPRHFCKNCQRYWTAGGTMRNVPVGAGRRKNKNSVANHYRHLTVQALPDCHALKPNGTVLSFGSDSPLCDSMASVLNLAEKTMKGCNRNGFHRLVEEPAHEERSSGSSVATVSNSAGDDRTGAANLQEPAIQGYQGGFNPHLPYINGCPWPYPWSPPAPPPAGAPSIAIPIPIYPAAAYWGCTNWSMPWVAPPLASPPIANGSSGPNSPTLGKHTRDGEVLQRGNDSNQERSLWIPKTLRIDDPEEAAKSSIWASMGFKNEKADGISSRGGLFKPFETKAELKLHKAETTAAHEFLHANPAALSRSANFQENS